MRVDFYQLEAGTPASDIVSVIAGRLLAEGGRLLIVHHDPAQRARLDRMLWDEGGASGFLPHGQEGSEDDARQPVLIAAEPVATNLARNILIADGEWRAAALGFDRAFYLFDEDSLADARTAWRSLGGEDGLERNYWARVDGRWTRKA